MNNSSIFDRKSKKKGFSLIEIMIVVVIIGILAVMAIPGVQKAVRASRNSAIINDLRVFAASFQQYAGENGDWPDDQPPGASFPNGMDGYLGESS